MTNVLIAIYGVYVFFKIFLELKEIFFIREKFSTPVLLNLEDFKTAALYSIYRHTFEIFNSIVSLFLVVLWLSGGIFILNFILYDGSLVSELEILGIFFGINYFLTLPVKIWEKQVEKKFGFNVASWKLFIIDEIKKIILFSIFGGLFFAGIIYFMENFENWWVIAFILSFCVVILVNILYPFFAMWFNKFEKLNDEDLKNSIQELIQKAGFKNNGIFVMDASKRDTRLNAYFAGLGKTKRVVLFDTLLKKLNKEEILAVLAHELGHFKNKDILKNIVVMGVVLFVIFFIFGNLPDSLFDSLKSKNGAVIIMLMVLFSDLIAFIISPLINFISRKNEFKADEFAKNLVGSKPLASALKKLIKENKHFPKVSKIYSLFYYTHPPILERLKKLGDKDAN